MLKSVIFLFVLAIGVLIGAFAFASADHPLNQGLAPAPEYPRNESGQTYGSALYATSPETEPDLIKAYGVDGTLGYVYASDLNGVQPKNPEEALAQQAKAVAQGDIKIPLYKADGKTVIGVYIINPGTVEIKTAE